MKKIFIIVPLLIATACIKNTRDDHAHVSIVQEKHDLMLSDQQIRLANITTQKITQRSIGESIFLNGRLTVNEQQSLSITSRAAGRVERLFIKETGETINKGQPLYMLYSETLLALQREYLLAKDQFSLTGKTEEEHTSFLDAAEHKLLLYGLTLNQIRQLDKNKLQNEVVILAPATGIVTTINITEGQYVPEGGLVYKIEQMETLWVEAEVYQAEASWIKNGDTLIVETSNGKNTESVVFQQTPELKSGTEITVVKARFPNPELQYKPGEQVQVHLTRSSHQAINLPSDAVIHDGHGSHVYVQTGKNTFQSRSVKTGMENDKRVEITAGLSEGDVVVVSGAYLIYSENILKNGSAISSHNH